MKKVWLLNSIIFLAAFLLFQIELIIAKLLLPKFGGTYAVWGAGLVFFQAMLLLGYWYAHFVLQKYGIKKYRLFHLGLLFLSLLFFPGRPLPAFQAQTHLPLVLSIFWQLLYTIGLSFFLLSTTSIIIQSWLAHSDLPEHTNPYALYAVSNLGSFLGLLTYPFFFELLFDLNVQLTIWRIAYFIFLLLHLFALKSIRVEDKGLKPTPNLNITINKDVIRWLLFSAAGVILFLSVTNIITYEIAPLPLFWILPLCIYLISFVLNFKQKPFCPAWIKDKFHIACALSIFTFLFTIKRDAPFMILMLLHLVMLFVICMFCHWQLYQHRPQDSTNLTKFYLVVATGGFVGGFITSWIIPLRTSSMAEYLVGLFVIAVALALKERIRIDSYSVRLIVYTILLLFLWPTVFRRYNIFGIVILVWLLKSVYSTFKTKPLVSVLSLLIMILLADYLDFMWAPHMDKYAYRNYYGIYKVYEEKGKRFLLNGTTIHGGQWLTRDKEMEQLTYYHKETGIAKLMESNLFQFNRIGVVGLGTGAMAAFGKPGQHIDFFELDPDVLKIAKRSFTYLKKSPSTIRVLLGDARVSLRNIPNKSYDLLIIDAFSGDSIPFHLLTIEAIAEYRRCIKDDGIILLHISNRYIELEPILFKAGELLRLHALSHFNSSVEGKTHLYPSLWSILTPDAKNYEKLSSELKWSKEPINLQIKNIRPWSDFYSNVLSVLRFKKLLNQIRDFKPFYWNFKAWG